MALNKIALLPRLRFDVERCVACARQVHAGIEGPLVSAQTGEGMGDWHAWLGKRAASASAAEALS